MKLEYTGEEENRSGIRCRVRAVRLQDEELANLQGSVSILEALRSHDLRPEEREQVQGAISALGRVIRKQVFKTQR